MSMERAAGLASNPLNPQIDKRVGSLINALRGASMDAQRRTGVADSARGFALQKALSNQSAGQICRGMVLFSVPHQNSYVVQLGDNVGRAVCSHLHQTDTTSTGAHRTSPYSAGTAVFVWVDYRDRRGFILGAEPPVEQNPENTWPGFVAQNSNARVANEPLYRDMYNVTGGADSVAYSCSAPLDAVPETWGYSFVSGVAIHASTFGGYFRASEACGLHLSALDDHADLHAVNIDISSGCHSETARIDHAQCRWVKTWEVYPWEAAGCYAPNLDSSTTSSDADAFAPAGPAKIDASPLQEPVSRVRHYQGYEGQGGIREVVAPARSAGLRRRDETEPDVGLFRESIGLDGSYLLESARDISFVRRTGIRAARNARSPEDPAGDDPDSTSRAGAFDASGEDLTARSVAGVLDALSYDWNVRIPSPFSGSPRDYSIPEEGADALGAGLGVLDYSPLARGEAVAVPPLVPLRIDRNYGSIDYARGASFIRMDASGSIVLGASTGARLILSATGRLRIEAPSGVEIVSGTEVVLLAPDVIVQAFDSVDISAGKDARVISGKNLQVSGGSLLLEARDETGELAYDNAVGTAVKSRGIVLKSAAELATVSKGRYEYADSVAIECKSGGIVSVNAGKIEAFSQYGLAMWVGTADDQYATQYEFAERTATIGADLAVTGRVRIVGEGNDLSVAGGGRFGNSVLADGSLASARGGLAAKVPDRYGEDLQEFNRKILAGVKSAVSKGKAAKTRTFDGGWNAPGRHGNPEFRRVVGASFRDDVDGVQYGLSEGFSFAQPQWFSLAQKAGIGGSTKRVPQVLVVQGRDTCPWPGLKFGRFSEIGDCGTFDYRAGLSRPEADARGGSLAPLVHTSLREGLGAILKE